MPSVGPLRGAVPCVACNQCRKTSLLNRVGRAGCYTPLRTPFAPSLHCRTPPAGIPL